MVFACLLSILFACVSRQTNEGLINLNGVASVLATHSFNKPTPKRAYWILVSSIIIFNVNKHSWLTKLKSNDTNLAFSLQWQMCLEVTSLFSSFSEVHLVAPAVFSEETLIFLMGHTGHTAPSSILFFFSKYRLVHMKDAGLLCLLTILNPAPTMYPCDDAYLTQTC